MKRDIDLARQLLLDIEARGADCSVSVLRSGADHDAEERVRYHLRLLIDAGYLKEIDRTSNGVPCLRLTDAGHELIELCRSEGRWREAKRACYRRTGGQSLTVVRGTLLQWAMAPAPRYRRRYRGGVDSLLVDGPVVSPLSDLEPYVEDWDDADDQVRYVRVQPSYRNGWRPRSRPFLEDRTADLEFEPTLPEHLI